MAKDRPRPWSEAARYKGPPVDSAGWLVKHPLRLGQAESLAAMTQDFVFFTPAVLYLYGGFSDAPLIDCMCELGRTIDLYYHKFQQPIFAGLETPVGDKDWNFVLWGVAVADWQPLADFVCSLTMASSTRRLLYKVGEQEFKVLDPLAIARCRILNNAVPVLTVAAFGLSGSAEQWAFDTGLVTMAAPPCLRRLPPEAGMADFAAAYFKGVNPYAAREQAARRLPGESDG